MWDTGWNFEESVELLGALDHESLNVPIVALVEEPDHAPQIWQSGVQALLSRDVDVAALVAAMRAVMAGLCVLAPEFIAALDIDNAQRQSLHGAGASIDSADLRRASLPEPLTPREMDVLQLVAQGLPNKTIARRLEISEHTVKFHMNAILGKLNAQSRTEAVVNAGRAGIIQV
jgi:two-component system, NarL family, nitrate/nitrite response regulator NarL